MSRVDGRNVRGGVWPVEEYVEGSGRLFAFDSGSFEDGEGDAPIVGRRAREVVVVVHNQHRAGCRRGEIAEAIGEGIPIVAEVIREPEVAGGGDQEGRFRRDTFPSWVAARFPASCPDADWTRASESAPHMAFRASASSNQTASVIP
jgi:hypothetical protein